MLYYLTTRGDYMLNDKITNQYIAQAKSIVDAANSTKNIDDKLKTCQYIVTSAMLIYYGSTIDLYKVLKSIDWISTDLSICDYMVSTYNRNLSNSYTDGGFIPAITLRHVEYLNCHDINSIKLKTNIVVSLQEKTGILLLLETLIHEINHVVNAYINNLFVEDGSIFSRLGLYKSKIDGKARFNLGLEEGVNTLQTEEIMKIVFALSKCNIQDENIRDILKHMSKIIDIFGDDYESGSYADIKSRLSSLYYDPNMYSFLKLNRLYGNHSDIEMHFDQYAGNGGFKSLNSALDDIVNGNSDDYDKADFYVKKFLIGSRNSR